MPSGDYAQVKLLKLVDAKQIRIDHVDSSELNKDLN